MRLVQTITDLDDIDRGASAAIGNFDGVHRGHQAVIDLARDTAQQLACPLGVVTFEPHPRQYFAPTAPAFRLMNAATKAHRLEKLGVDRVYQVPFNAALAELTPREFAEKVLAHGLGLRHVVIGSDFCFGKGRAGTAADLVRFGEELGFGVTVADLLTFRDGNRPVSSTRIRAALSDGRPRDAMAMLGHWHRIDGPVLHGEKRGRTLGYPTANMGLDGLHLPKLGVYAVEVDVLTGPHAGRYHGVASLGVRPMFGENSANLESFLFDFSGDLYDAELSVALVDYLRPEMTFDGIDALIVQMDQDSRRARELLAQL
ncbi:bifunctional riboflavin kinase/FAD synthetase [Pseudoruegeria sp. SK021]|uniref:bifunctional riboflavin kinase/FAD synthetase n=1 Tax=Pseudoruegeria sp. SK021 TaxID=1933035 RepID=UPI000A250C8B|nr:bifunctional riboflavin kinase/FAD synthetase [Pseudoruegeria sp. SK021]OSP54162.1 riboflavin biosynthesis protein RibF [Pseudoruegeria sp. SK021]